MSTFAEKIGLQKTFHYELNINQEEFGTLLKHKIGPKDFGYFFDIIDLFSFSGKAYKGSVTSNGFKIRKIRGFFSTNNNQVTATGTLVQQDKLYVHTVISGVNYSLYIFAFSLIFLPFVMFRSGFDEENPILFFIIAFIVVFHYFSIRRGIERLKEDMEKDFQLESSKND